MMLAGFLFLFLLTGGSAFNDSELFDDQQMSNDSFEKSGSTSNYSEQPTAEYVYEYPDQITKAVEDISCTYMHIFYHLNLTKNKELYTMGRPVKDHRKPTRVYLQMSIYAILDVRDIDQIFIPYVWIYMSWINEHIRWYPPDYCGLEQIVVPKEYLWRPDLTIEEMTEMNKAPPSPYLTIDSNGRIHIRIDQMLVSSCKMSVYKFPFDIQSCDLSFKSAMYNDKELEFEVIDNSSRNTQWSRMVMKTQFEWVFLNMTVKKTASNNLRYNQSMIVYTIKMKRQSVLYIANFVVPIMFFFLLDLASFLISESGGEKLGFQVSLLLAVTVMQLLLNEILPSYSDGIPLIVVYCFGMFGLMLLSLMKTILVIYLFEKDNEADKDQSLSEDGWDKQDKANSEEEVKKWTHLPCVCDVSADEPPSELLTMTKEGTSSQLTEESNALEKVSDELREMEKMLTLLLNSKKEERKPGYWTRVTKTINRVFLVFYITAAIVFLSVIFPKWHNAADE